MSTPGTKSEIERLARTARRHPDLVVQVVELMADGGEQAEDHLREFFKHAQPNVRCAAVRGLSTSLQEGASDILLAALTDESEQVRITAAQSALQQLERVRPDDDDLLRRAGKLRPNNVLIEPAPSLGERLFDWFRKGAKARAIEEERKATQERDKPPEEDGKIDPLEAEFDSLDVPDLDPDDRPPPKPPAGREQPQKSPAEPAAFAPPKVTKQVELPRKQPQVTAPPEETDRAAGDAEAAARAALEAATAAAESAQDTRPTMAKPIPGPADVRFVAETLPDLEAPSRARVVEDDGESLWDGWIEEFRSGKGRPTWMDQLVPPLVKMLDAESPQERCAAAVTLIALGKVEIGVAALTEAVHEQRELAYTAGDALKWLVWEERIALFKRLRRLAVGNDQIRHLLYQMRDVPERRAAPVFWEMLADEEIDDSVAEAVQAVIVSAYSGRRWADLDDIEKATKEDILKTAKPRATTGPEHQRLASMGMLTYVDQEAALAAARANLNDPDSSTQLRKDCLQVLLAVLPQQQATDMAVENVKSPLSERRNMAMHYLAFGTEGWYSLRGFSYNMSHRVTTVYGSGSTRLKLKAPDGLKAEHLIPLLNSEDKDIAAQAGYLLALLGNDSGLPELIQQWRQHPEHDSWTRLVYRAISVLDDSRRIDVLREIYAMLGEWEMRDFYWTIRTMTGSEILKLRKKIRDEVGMNNLK
jgi:HEAT repeat protein